MGWLKNFILKSYFKIIQKKINHWQENPLSSQRAVFNKLLHKGLMTSFGKEHRFHQIKNYEDFKANVPLHTYDLLLKYIDRIRVGEKDVLWPGRPLYLATTSGTTSGEKYIPVTKDSLKKGMASTVLCSASYITETDNTDPLNRKMVILSANPELKKDSFLQYGKITGIFNKHIPNFMKSQRIPSIETNMIWDWEKKMIQTVKESIGQDVGMIGGFPAWIIRYFERVLEETGKDTIAEVFPNLQVITHGGVSYPPYKKRMESLIGKPFHRLEVFSASEGFMAYQDKQDRDDLLLVTSGEIFYEFVPLEDCGKESPRRFQLSEVEVGVNYAIYISTMGGLWAYEIGDTVTFTQTKPYRLKVSGRTKHFISNSGEHLISEQVEMALGKTCDKLNVEVNDFSVAPSIKDEPGGNRHEWLIEFKSPPKNLSDFSSELSLALREVSDNYNLLVESEVLNLPIITPLKKGAFVEYMKSINKMTHQNKVPRLMNNRELANGIQPWALDGSKESIYEGHY